MTISIKDGVYTPIVTFYKADGETIDYDTQIKHGKYLTDNGIEGLVVLGSTGENALLTPREKIELISKLSSNIDTTIIVGVSQFTISEAVDTISDYKQAGASIAMVLPSFYYGNDTTQQGIIDWYTEVANQSALPIILYIFPGVSNGLQVLPETVAKLSKHPNIIGCKCSHGDVHQYSRISLNKDIEANNFKLLSGQGQLLLPLISINGKGVIDGLSNCFPKTFVKMFKLLDQGKFEEAKELQFIASEAEVFASQCGFLGLKRAIKDHLHLGESIVGRKPMNYPISDDVWNTKYKHLYDLIKNYEDSI